MAPELQLIFKADGSVVHNELEMKWISLCTEDEEVFIKMYNVSVSLQSLSVVHSLYMSINFRGTQRRFPPKCFKTLFRQSRVLLDV